ncbi:ATP-binding protein [candidate division KSB1 bacterium]|nr:ATP-binding protein [candidate division KSB1 bacterium]
MNDPLHIMINSFSYHQSGIPCDDSGNNGGFVFDCRCLPNPGREEKYKSSTGRDPDVIEYFRSRPVVSQYLSNVKAIIDIAVDNYIERGFSQLMISFGCTGGQHRSVYCAEAIYEHLQNKRVLVQIHHLEFEDM